jgi:hypothetical protein
MSENSADELIYCPNCKENIPKTLYCLNCGYPLYKIEQEKKDRVFLEDNDELAVEETTEINNTIELEPTIETEVNEEVEEIVEPPKPEPEEHEVELEEDTIKIEEPEPEAPEEPEEVKEIVEPPKPEPEEPEVEVEEDTIKTEEPEPEAPEEPEEVKEIVEPPKPESIEPEVEVEADVSSVEIDEKLIVAEPSVHEPESLEVSIQEDESGEIVREVHSFEETSIMEELKIEYAPDPITKEVMDNLAKNITLKVRLIRLLRDGQVKEETFEKLFGNYVEQGRIWSGRRDEILNRLRSDFGSMEDKLGNAKKEFELLEIRKSIGDAEDTEYNVKAPAYKWDIQYLEKEIVNRKSGIKYVEDLRRLVPSDEILELESYEKDDYNQIDSINGINNEVLVKIKENLVEILGILSN